LRRLEGRVAVVTGAASGIGAATVRRFEREGAHVVRVDLTETDGDFVKRDVSDEDQVRALFDGVVQRHGRVDIAFNNAGISPPDDDSILDTEIAAWERVLKVNATSVYLCGKYVLPHMLEAGRGSIINTASFVGCWARRRVRLPTQRVKELCCRSPWNWVFSSPKAALE